MTDGIQVVGKENNAPPPKRKEARPKFFTAIFSIFNPNNFYRQGAPVLFSFLRPRLFLFQPQSTMSLVSPTPPRCGHMKSFPKCRAGSCLHNCHGCHPPTAPAPVSFMDIIQADKQLWDRDPFDDFPDIAQCPHFLLPVSFYDDDDVLQIDDMLSNC